MSIHEDPISDGSPFQFRLRSMFLLMLVAAAVSALGHYFGVIVLRWLAIGVVLMVTFAFVALGPGLVTEVLTSIIDKSLVVIGVTRRALHKRLTVAANRAKRHKAAVEPGRRRSVQRALTSARRVG